MPAWPRIFAFFYFIFTQFALAEKWPTDRSIGAAVLTVLPEKFELGLTFLTSQPFPIKLVKVMFWQCDYLVDKKESQPQKSHRKNMHGGFLPAVVSKCFIKP